MDEKFNQTMIDLISKKLFKSNVNLEQRNTPSDVEFSNKQLMFEQYKLLIDSAQKIDERRGSANNFFVSINTIFISFVLANPLKFQALGIYHLPLLGLLVLVGIVISWDWLKIINSYRKLNYINYSLIQALEKEFPSCVFSLRGEIEAIQAEEKAHNRVNIILIQEMILPKMFLFIYTVFFIIIIFCDLKPH